MLNTYKVFDNLHMLWMCIWMCPYHIKAALKDHAFGSELEIWVTPNHQLMVKCGD
jgi:Ran GTPase-activating protein (RanGAP) involved in mRNA processing and transport